MHSKYKALMCHDFDSVLRSSPEYLPQNTCSQAIFSFQTEKEKCQNRHSNTCFSKLISHKKKKIYRAPVYKQLVHNRFYNCCHIVKKFKKMKTTMSMLFLTRHTNAQNFLEQFFNRFFLLLNFSKYQKYLMLSP